MENQLDSEELIPKGYWVVCPQCQGHGRKRRRPSGKARRNYQNALKHFERIKNAGSEVTPVPEPTPPQGHIDFCLECHGTGLDRSPTPPFTDKENYPHIAIIGGGIGGVALAVACLHRGVPFTLYERDSGFNARSQGYGLTLQQASKAIQGLGISSLVKGIVSTRHVVHKTDGKIIGEWGVRKWVPGDDIAAPKRTNVHIARQALRSELLEQLGEHDSLKWSHQLVDFKENDDPDSNDVRGVTLTLQVNGELKTAQADLLVGADGIRSSVRRLLIGEDATPLQYLGCIVILGICPLADLDGLENTLLDSATVFQTANGHERIYMMPYDEDSVMWQLSFPMPEEEAKALSEQGSQALKDEAIRRCQWHEPIPQILAATQAQQVSGYPVYDRALLTPELLQKSDYVTLLGDAAHPMSPFKGQGANQALLDALALARGIAKGCRPRSGWREQGIRESCLTDFEKEMLERSAAKVKDSAEAAAFLHSDTVLYEGDEPRGRCIRRKRAEES
ncbi:FAD-dependent monooxygenase [Akkermansiaceae bacterium]|nr:FAD-dependent monooxygenase [Akkermansiaceae bacterium]